MKPCGLTEKLPELTEGKFEALEGQEFEPVTWPGAVEGQGAAEDVAARAVVGDGLQREDIPGAGEVRRGERSSRSAPAA